MQSCSQFGKVRNGYLQSLQPSSALFCIDSKTSLESLTARKPVYFFLVYNCLVIVHHLFERGFRGVAFQWVPAHCGLYGNEKAHLTAKEASEGGTISNSSPAMWDYNSVAKKKWTTSLQKQCHKDNAQTF